MESNEDIINASSIYDFTVNDIDGNEYKLSQLKGQVVLIVNGILKMDDGHPAAII